MLHAELSHAVGGVELDIRFDVPPGRCLALAGPSGAGKTTILRVVAGMVRPDRGRIANGQEVWADSTSGVWLPPERRRCGYVFQDYALFPHLSAWRNVAYGLRSTPASRRKEAAHELLDRFFARDESYRTISEELELPSGTVASRISRCLAKLRSELEGRNLDGSASGGQQ